MADIDFYADINDDNPEDGFGLDDSLDGEDNYGTDDKLTPLQKLEKYMQSDNVYTRQMVARGLLDTLRAVEENEEDSTSVLNAMVRLSEDSDPIVRSELMEQVPHIAVYCHEDNNTFPNAVPLYVLPMVVRYLNDPHNQVRKTSQAALLVLLEQELIGKADIEEQVVNVILDLACPDSLDDYRTEAVALMSKMAPLLGKEMTERLFLPRYCEMCTDPLFHVRKVCAANFGDICTVVGQGNTEQQLLPKFYYLCEDGVWGVRKACAECFMAVSCACSPDVRRGELSTLFVNLLCDLSRWVRMAAFQQLGPFISTFADPCITGLYVSDDGILCVQNPEKLYALENFERLRDLGEQLGGEALCLDEEGRGRDTEENTNTGFLSDHESQAEPSFVCDKTTDDVEPMDLSETSGEQAVVIAAKSIENSNPDGTEVSLEERRAEEYRLNQSCIAESPGQNNPVSEKLSESCSQSSTEDNQLSVSESSSCKKDITDDDHANVGNVDLTNTDSNTCDSTSSIQSDDPSAGSEGEKPEVVHIHLENIGNFNSFQYWRNPLPEIDLDFDFVNGAAKNVHVTAKVKDEEHHKIYATEMNVSMPSSSANITSNSNTVSSSDSLSSDMTSVTLGDKTVISSSENVVEESGIKIHTASVNTVSETGETVDNIGSTHVLGQQLNETTMKVVDGVVQDVHGSNLGYIDDSLRDSIESVDEARLAQQQDIVPQSLLESYLGMVDPSRAQTVDTEITRHCAYNLPAVAYTLGRKNWNCIKSLYEVLATDMQWKVRRTLAFSIHEMALILGEEITHRDLVPVFDGFLKDLDEVRIGVLKHLADFLRLLRPDVRKQYLTKVESFMNTDNHRNWRFRLELADQLMLISELYTAEEVSKCLLSLGFTLAEDKVAEVRLTAFRLLSVMLKRLTREGDQMLAKRLMMELVEKFAQSNKWAKRQIFAQLVQCILDEDAVALETFTKELVPSLLSLSHDSVPNVRIALAKTMSRHLFTQEFFSSPKNPMYEQMCKTLQNLQSDSDRDVRYFAHPQPEYTYMEDDFEDEKPADKNQNSEANTLPV